ncbi:4Fe-4S dicluster domain-containing protein, partial [Rhodopseudomonas palustris]|uniref:4Fe-4S dicluster domain-containing protein n=1 Tax=Rhodopseudomonas palustris TaxID=1076 RepID=UPI0006427D2A
TTYTLAGFMREQVCIYMCPWPRIQAALTDEWALNVTYRYDRGEPRMSVKKAEVIRAQGEIAGDCIDCHQCVNVCPTGVDIRQGLQLGCVQCGLCIDACNTVMKQVGRPPDLIAYDTDLNIQRRLDGKSSVYRPVRARTLMYSGLIVLVAAVMVYALATRGSLDLNVLHERNPLFVTLSDGSVRNDYTVRLLNKRPTARVLQVSVSGVPGARLQAVGLDPDAKDRLDVEVGQDQTRELRVSVLVPSNEVPSKSINITFEVKDPQTGETATSVDHFVPPTSN